VIFCEGSEIMRIETIVQLLEEISAYVALGSLLLYSTWTTVYFACFAPLMFIRARHEEDALSAEFGDQCQEYCKQVPMFFPRFRKNG
jgi:protein-S-isoprenylcysteine O-methyltransferase Ste14